MFATAKQEAADIAPDCLLVTSYSVIYPVVTPEFLSFGYYYSFVFDGAALESQKLADEVKLTGMNSRAS